MVGRLERNKDLLQVAVENTATRVGAITSIITTAVADIAREVGELVTDGFEMRDAATAARNAELQRGRAAVAVDPVEQEKLHADEDDDEDEADGPDDEQF